MQYGYNGRWGWGNWPNGAIAGNSAQLAADVRIQFWGRPGAELSGLCGNWNGDVRDEPGDSSYGYVNGDIVDSGENMKAPANYAYSATGVQVPLVQQGGSTAYDIIQYGKQGTPAVRGSTATNADGTAIITGGNIDSSSYNSVTAEVATSYTADGSIASTATQTQVLDFFADNKKFGWTDPRNLFMLGAPTSAWGNCLAMAGTSTPTYCLPSSGLTLWYRNVGADRKNAWPLKNSVTGGPNPTFSGNLTFPQMGSTFYSAYLHGDYSAKITFGTLSTTFTVCAVTKYDGPNNAGRILQGDNSASGQGPGRWVFGHEGGAVGVVNFNDQFLVNVQVNNGAPNGGGGFTELAPPNALKGWLLMCSTNAQTTANSAGGSVWTLDPNCNLINTFSGSTTWYSSSSTMSGTVSLNIGATASLGGSNGDWGLYELAVYSRALADSEMQTTLQYMQAKVSQALGLTSSCR